MKIALLVVGIMVSLTCCQYDIKTSEEQFEQIETLFGQSYHLIVTHVWQGQVDHPFEPLSDNDFAPIPNQIRYWLRFSHDGSTLEIARLSESRLATGHQIEKTQGWILFEVEYFASGKLSIATKPEEISAELIIYGSGIPIVSAERGLLVPVEE